MLKIHLLVIIGLCARPIRKEETVFNIVLNTASSFTLLTNNLLLYFRISQGEHELL